MPAFTTVLGFAALASALVRAAPIEARGAPKTWAYGYLEDYDAYHLRYLALGCQNKHNTTFFSDCCHPLLATASLSDRPAYCTPNATEVASASSYIASTSMYGPPTATASTDCASETTSVCDDTPTTTAKTTTTDTPKVAAAEPTTTTKAAEPTTTYVAPTTTKTTPAYVAPTTTSTTPKAAATTQAASQGSDVKTGGFATFFYQGGQAGACGNYHSDSDYVIAIDQAYWPDFGQQSQYCGRWITVQNTQNGKTVTAVVADVCPTCVNGNSLDLSVGAFQAIASESDGMVPINWWFA